MAVDDDYDDDDETLDDEEPAVKGKTPLLVIVLIFLNLLTLPALLFLLVKDFETRTNWAQATLLNHVHIWGLPLEEEENANTLSQASRRVQVGGDQVRDAFKKRPNQGTQVKGGEDFQNVDEAAPIRIKPSHLDERMQKDLGLNPPVRTLDEEVARLEQLVPAEIERLAKEFVAKQGTADKKREAAREILLPLAWNYAQVDALNKQIDDAQDPAQLSALLDDAVQRRMLADILAPLNVQRPGNMQKFTVEKLAETKAYPLDVLKGLLGQQFKAAVSNTHTGEVYQGAEFDGKDRDSVDKRRNIASLLMVLSQVKIPQTNEPALPGLLDRGQAVAGLHEFAIAASSFVQAERTLEERVLEALKADREGYEVLVKDKTGQDVLSRTPGFVQAHDAQIQRLKKIVADIAFTEDRLKRVSTQRDEYRKLYDERMTHLKEMTAKLSKARIGTAAAASELQALERETFLANQELAEAAERNVELERKIRRSQGLKGAN